MNLETYLKQATRGIWGKRKIDAILELRGNIEARIWALEHEGKTQAEALETALQELGDARVVNAGMTQVHTMPNVTRNILIVGLISSVTVLGWTSSTAQIQAVYPMVKFFNTLPGNLPPQPSFLSLDNLKTELQTAGAAVLETYEAVDYAGPTNQQPDPNWAFDGPSPKATRTLTITFPDSKEIPLRLQAIPRLSLNAEGLNPSFAADEDIYISLKYITEELRRVHLPIQLNGWQNPTLSIGKTTLKLGTAQQPAFAQQIYDQIGSEFYRHEVISSNQMRLPNGVLFDTSPDKKSQLFTHSVRTSNQPGTAYAVFAVEDPTINECNCAASSFMRLETARVNDQGVLQFSAVWKNLEFVKNFKPLEADYAALWKKITPYQHQMIPAAARDQNLGKTKRPMKAVLVRLTGRLDALEPNAIIELPARARSTGLR
jgi:hypothetical protein